MKNVTSLTELRRLLKSLAVSFIFLILALAGSSFTNLSNNITDELKKSGRDSSRTDKNAFPDLFSLNSENLYPGGYLLHPKGLKYVQSFVQSNSNRLNKMKVWGKPYLDIFDVILTQHGLPKELKYLSVVESSLYQRALSPVGAGGPWQIMPNQARDLGLIVNSKVDERRNYYKSTHAAAKFMKDLYRSFEDWLLVIAAYNCGPGRLRQAIRKSGSRDFWVLQKFLPLETRNHVKNFIGTHYVFEGTGGLTTMTALQIANYNVNLAGLKPNSGLNDEELNRTMSVTLSGKYVSSVLSKTIGLDLTTFNKFNPGFDELISTGKPTSLRLPVDKMMLFENKKRSILIESVNSIL